MDNYKTYLAPLGRLLMSSLFIWAGIGNLLHHAGNVQYFTNVHIPSPEVMVWVVGIVELVLGIAILVGFMTRWAAALLAIFCVVTAFGVHLPAGDIPNMVNFYKNLVMTGGFLYIVAYGAGAISVDGRAA